jgi:hypothetical protein
MARNSRRGHGREDQGPHKGGGKTARTEKGPSPRKWELVVLPVVKKEGHKILSDVQYDHVVEVLKRLVDFGNKEEIGDLDIKPIQSFFEPKEKGGLLGRINLRVYFGTFPEENKLVIAKAYKKDEEGPPPRHIVLLVQDRLEQYKAGGLRR